MFKEYSFKENNIIKAKYYTNKGLIEEGNFNSYDTFEQILNYFEKNNKNKTYKLKPKYIFNGKEINNNQIISNLIHINSNSSLESAEIWIEIDVVPGNPEENEKKEENIIVQKKILKPSRNNIKKIWFERL